eukprot:scaffold3227_cov188-Ochromonas_danica.AAC.14
MSKIVVPSVSKPRTYCDYRWRCCLCTMEHPRDQLLCAAPRPSGGLSNPYSSPTPTVRKGIDNYERRADAQNKQIYEQSATCSHSRCLNCPTNWRA